MNAGAATAAGTSRRVPPAVLILVLVLVAACSSVDASHYATVLDQLSYPSTWQLAHTRTQRLGGPDKAMDPTRPGDDIDCMPGLGDCPSVTRYFVVAGSPADGYTQAKKFMSSGGFAVREDLPQDCWFGPGDVACVLDATKGPDHLFVNFYYPSIQAEGIRAPDTDHIVVRLTANHNDAATT